MKPDFNAIALFVRVIEYKSFTETSRRLGIPISTVSRKVSELEKSLGVRLLERSTRRLRLTELGQEYYQYCRRGVEEFEIGSLVLGDRQVEVSGTLHISLPPNLSEHLVMPIACAFQDIYPKTCIKILVTKRYVDLIEDGVDIAFRVGKLESSSMFARHLLTYRHLLVASPQYIEAHGEPAHPNDLGTHRLITFGGWQEELLWKLESGHESHKLVINANLSVNEMTAIQYAAEAGRGIAEIPAIICARALHCHKLVEVMPTWRFSPTTLSAIYPSNRNTSRLVKLFLDFCVSYIGQHMPYTGVDATKR